MLIRNSKSVFPNHHNVHIRFGGISTNTKYLFHNKGEKRAHHDKKSTQFLFNYFTQGTSACVEEHRQREAMRACVKIELNFLHEDNKYLKLLDLSNVPQ